MIHSQKNALEQTCQVLIALILGLFFCLISLAKKMRLQKDTLSQH